MRQEFGASQQTALAETAATAVAAREQAAVQARYIVALQRPRDVEAFRSSVLRECKRPGFASIAEYHRPVGREFNEDTGQWEEKIADGPSVHLMRTAAMLYGNMMVDSAVTFDGKDLRIVHAYALDLQHNCSWARTVAVSKIVEKRAVKDRKTGQFGPPPGREIAGERINSKGETTYIVYATDDEIRVKEARLVALAQRENLRSVLPRDIIDEARYTARETLSKEDAKDPDAARRKIIDSFSELGVSPSDLSAWLGHTTERIDPAELKALRGIFVSMREGDVTWDEIMESRGVTGSEQAQSEVLAAKLAAARSKTTPKTENGGAQGETAKAAQPARTEREVPGASTPGQEFTDEQNRELDRQLAEAEQQATDQRNGGRKMNLRRGQ